MKCRQCAAEIAEKAIVCYRCGTPTADLPSPNLQQSSGGRRSWVWILMVLLILAGAMVFYFMSRAAPPA